MPDYKLSRPSHSLNLRRVQPLAAKRLGAEAGFLLPTFCFSFAVGEEENKKKKKARVRSGREASAGAGTQLISFPFLLLFAGR